MAMADGYAQASAELAVLNLHVAPGLGNAMGMLYDAHEGEFAGAGHRRPAGQEYLVTEPVLTADLPTLARPFVKWAAEVHRAEDLPRYVHRAVKTALAPPTGPVFLSLPGDILKNDADIDLLEPTRVAPRVRGDAEPSRRPPNCSPRPSGRSSSPAMPWRRAARTRSSSRWRKPSPRRSMSSSFRTAPRFRRRIRSIAA